jgi:hypothetical protein
MALIVAIFRLRSEKVDADCREMISVNFGCRHVPGDGDDTAGREGLGVEGTSATVVADIL